MPEPHKILLEIKQVLNYRERSGTEKNKREDYLFPVLMNGHWPEMVTCFLPPYMLSYRLNISRNFVFIVLCSQFSSFNNSNLNDLQNIGNKNFYFVYFGDTSWEEALQPTEYTLTTNHPFTH